MERKPNTTSKTQQNNTELLMKSLVRFKSDDCIVRILENGCNLNKTTPLQEAAKRYSTRVAEELIRRGANINAQGLGGLTALHEAVQSNNMEMVTMLLYYEANVHMVNDLNRTPLLDVFDNNKLDLAVTLIPHFNGDRFMANIINAHYLNLLTPHRANSDYRKFVEYFKLLTPRTNPKIFLESEVPFLVAYLLCCTYTSYDWLQCLDLILNLPYASQLVQQCFSFKQRGRLYIFVHLFRNLILRGVKSRDRTAMMWKWLSLGATVDIHAINSLIQICGFSAEVEVLMQSVRMTTICCPSIAPLTLFMLGMEDMNYFLKKSGMAGMLSEFIDFGLDRHIREELQQWQHFVKDIQPKDFLKNLLRFFSLPRNCIPTMLMKVPGLGDHSHEMMKVPSLVELARNQTRSFLRERYEIRKPYQMREIITNLPLPMVIIDIIRFKRPVNFYY